MKKSLVVLVGMMVASSLVFGEKKEFTIMTYNVRHCAGMDLKLNIEKTASVIKEQNPRFVALQEMDSKTKRSNNVDQAAKLGELTGLEPTFGATIDFNGGKYGVAILSKEKPIKVEQIALPPRTGETRTALIAEFEDVYFISTHWVHNKGNSAMRMESAKIIAEKAKELKDKPIIICGDLNSLPPSQEIKEFKKTFTVLSPENCRSYHGSEAVGPSGTVDDFCIDYIAIDNKNVGKFKVLSSYVVNDDKTSDHKPLVVKVEKK